MQGCHVQCGNAAVGRSRDVKLAAGDLVAGGDHPQELREDALASFKEQLAFGRRGRHDEIAPAFGLGSEK